MIKTVILACIVIAVVGVKVYPEPYRIIESKGRRNGEISVNIESICMVHHAKTGHELIDTGYYF